MTEEEIDHSHTDEIVCPHCGYEFEDSWDCGNVDKDTKMECCNEECEKEFMVCGQQEYYYTTWKKDWLDDRR